MGSCEILLFLACMFLLGGLRFTSTTTTTSLIAAMSIANQDLERYFHSVNRTQTLASEERIAMDVYTYAFLNYSYMENQQLKVINYQEEKARYGEGKILTVQGKLIHISTPEDLKDDSACSFNLLGTNGNPLPLFSVSWIALVRRGRCTFEEKVKNVFLNGASGVIIFNDKPVMNLEKMQIKGKTRNITAVITYQDIGLEMAMRVDQGFDVSAHIIEGRSGMRPINSLNRTSVLFVAISFIILMVISLVWLIFYYIQKFRYMQSKDQQSRHLCSVTKKAIMKIPTKTGKSTDEKDAESDCCAICIEAYKASDLIRVLPCRHEFHKSCIDPWLIEHRTCPMCKLDVLKFYGYVFIGSEESILEFPAENIPDTSTNPSAANRNSRPTGALADLIRSRDFVIDFPRVFVLEGGAETRRRSSTFHNGIPERSQSSMGLSQAKDWMCTVANKLEEQHGLRRARRDSQKMEMHENLLSVRQDSLKMRRSHSTEGRYCVRKEFESPETPTNNLEQNSEGACGGQMYSNSRSSSRRNSTSAIFSQLQPIAALKFDILNKRRKSNTSRRTSEVTLQPWAVKETEVQPKAKEDDLPNITIEIVDEDN